jgi:general stress protein 26
MSPHDPEVRDFLARSMIARVATLCPKGRPHMTPLWFVWDQGRIYMTSRDGSPAARNVSAHPAVVLLFDAERGPRPDRVLRIQGNATFRKERDLLRLVVRRQGRKYWFSLGGLRHLLSHPRQLPATVRYYTERRENAGVIEVTPERAEFLKRVEEGH